MLPARDVYLQDLVTEALRWRRDLGYTVYLVVGTAARAWLVSAALVEAGDPEGIEVGWETLDATQKRIVAWRVDGGDRVTVQLY